MPKHSWESPRAKRAHLTAAHERETQPMSSDTSSIRSNSTSTNQTQERRSMDPPGHATDIVSCQVTKNRPMYRMRSQHVKGGGPEADHVGRSTRKGGQTAQFLVWTPWTILDSFLCFLPKFTCTHSQTNIYGIYQ